MKEMQTGQFFGETDKIMHLDGITLTKTVYTHDYVDWHYHQNAYFTFLLRGGLIETDRKKTVRCAPGDLLFHYWQESHCNIKPPEFTQGFHIEIEQSWFDNLELDRRMFEGSFQITDPAVRIAFYSMARELGCPDTASVVSIEDSLCRALVHVSKTTAFHSNKPLWVTQIRDVLHARPFDTHTLLGLAMTLHIHPVHLSRAFTQYFGVPLGTYIRQIRLQKSIERMYDPSLSLTNIALQCGFSDQSHFVRCFKAVTGITPLRYRRELCKINEPC
ncbi:MAG TPA: AraC family transcriptional regulator [bacterium]|nr:AraC family transcriptional regulator [bacterium]HMW31931.1 AraC family transcriptional regulator [bacterium]HMW35240.1 AraC family transcriptional regulator [bacterium]HMY34521.1 AraC family transcriptional regulator [bacterium]HMZ03793.1 AraC family transcriptional regulator [bacterium]